MAEGRFISKSIATNGQLKRVSLEADYLFGRMIPHLDREGRIDGDPDVVKAMACPLRGELTPELIATCLAELDTMGLIEWYEVDGRQVAQFPAFKAHQRGMKPERERASVLPERGAQGAKPVRRTVNSGARAEPAVQPPATVAANSPTSAPKLSEVKVSKVKFPAKAGGWVARFGETFAAASGGIAPHGEIGNHLKPLIERDGEDPTHLRWARFCASEKRQFGAAYFAKNAGDFDPSKAGVLPMNKEERAAYQFKKRGYVT